MTTRTVRTTVALSMLFAAAVLAGCSSSRNTAIDGYEESVLAGKRVFVVVPQSVDVALTDQEAYASIRGTSGEAAREQLASDLRTHLVPELGTLLDSNTVLSYIDAPANGIHTINAARDFTASGPVSWDLIANGAKEANADFMLILNGMTIRTERTSARGTESIVCYYQLLDPAQKKVMTSGKTEADVSAVATPADVYHKLAERLVTKLPFTVGEGTGK